MPVLTKKELEGLHHALVEAYDKKKFYLLIYKLFNREFKLRRRETFEKAVLRELGSLNRGEEIGLVVEYFIETAREYRHAHPKLIAMAESLALKVSIPRHNNLEVLIEGSGYYNFRDFIDNSDRATRRVCRIEYDINGNVTASGTGFLIGPDLLLTNYHVIKPLIGGQIGSDKIYARFDYTSSLSAGASRELFVGNVYGFVEEPVLIYTEYDVLDTRNTPIDTEWPEGKLDYAILKLKEPVATTLAGQSKNSPESASKVRGFYNLLDYENLQIDERSDIIIAQHPKGEAMKMAWGQSLRLEESLKKRRIRYKVSTEKGSSGSPVFDGKWNLVALHHAGDPDYHELNYGDFNQGIPIKAIIGDLRSKNKVELVSAEPITIESSALPANNTSQADEDPYKKVYFRKKMPFINRLNLRAQIRDMVDRKSSRVLLIKKDDIPGLSYSYYLLQYLSDKFKCFELIRLDFNSVEQPANGSSYRAIDLASSLAAQLNVEFQLPVDSNKSLLKLQPFMSSLVGDMWNRSRPCLIFMDNFRARHLDAGGQEFVKSLVQVVDHQIPNLLFVLAGYDGDFPIDTLSTINEDATEVFNDNDLKEFFKTFHAELEVLTNSQNQESPDSFANNCYQLLIQNLDEQALSDIVKVNKSVSAICQFIYRQQND